MKQNLKKNLLTRAFIFMLIFGQWMQAFGNTTLSPIGMGDLTRNISLIRPISPIYTPIDIRPSLQCGIRENKKQLMTPMTVIIDKYERDSRGNVYSDRRTLTNDLEKLQISETTSKEGCEILSEPNYETKTASGQSFTEKMRIDRNILRTGTSNGSYIEPLKGNSVLSNYLNNSVHKSQDMSYFSDVFNREWLLDHKLSVNLNSCDQFVYSKYADINLWLDVASELENEPYRVVLFSKMFNRSTAPYGEIGRLLYQAERGYVMDKYGYHNMFSLSRNRNYVPNNPFLSVQKDLGKSISRIPRHIESWEWYGRTVNSTMSTTRPGSYFPVFTTNSSFNEYRLLRMELVDAVANKLVYEVMEKKTGQDKPLWMGKTIEFFEKNGLFTDPWGSYYHYNDDGTVDKAANPTLDSERMILNLWPILTVKERDHIKSIVAKGIVDVIGTSTVSDPNESRRIIKANLIRGANILGTIDNTINNILSGAEDLGCFKNDESYEAGMCNWLPEKFVETVKDDLDRHTFTEQEIMSSVLAGKLEEMTENEISRYLSRNRKKTIFGIMQSDYTDCRAAVKDSFSDINSYEDFSCLGNFYGEDEQKTTVTMSCNLCTKKVTNNRVSVECGDKTMLDNFIEEVDYSYNREQKLPRVGDEYIVRKNNSGTVVILPKTEDSGWTNLSISHQVTQPSQFRELVRRDSYSGINYIGYECKVRNVAPVLKEAIKCSTSEQHKVMATVDIEHGASCKGKSVPLYSGSRENRIVPGEYELQSNLVDRDRFLLSFPFEKFGEKMLKGKRYYHRSGARKDAILAKLMSEAGNDYTQCSVYTNYRVYKYNYENDSQFFSDDRRCGNSYGQSTDCVEKYVRNTNSYRKYQHLYSRLQLADVDVKGETKFTRTDKEVSIGDKMVNALTFEESRFGAHQMGNDAFNVHMGYAYGWGVTGFEKIKEFYDTELTEGWNSNIDQINEFTRTMEGLFSGEGANVVEKLANDICSRVMATQAEYNEDGELVEGTGVGYGKDLTHISCLGIVTKIKQDSIAELKKIKNPSVNAIKKVLVGILDNEKERAAKMLKGIIDSGQDIFKYALGTCAELLDGDATEKEAITCIKEDLGFYLPCYDKTSCEELADSFGLNAYLFGYFGTGAVAFNSPVTFGNPEDLACFVKEELEEATQAIIKKCADGAEEAVDNTLTALRAELKKVDETCHISDLIEITPDFTDEFDQEYLVNNGKEIWSKLKSKTNIETLLDELVEAGKSGNLNMEIFVNTVNAIRGGLEQAVNLCTEHTLEASRVFKNEFQKNMETFRGTCMQSFRDAMEGDAAEYDPENLFEVMAYARLNKSEQIGLPDDVKDEENNAERNIAKFYSEMNEGKYNYKFHIYRLGSYFIEKHDGEGATGDYFTNKEEGDGSEMDRRSYTENSDEENDQNEENAEYKETMKNVRDEMLHNVEKGNSLASEEANGLEGEAKGKSFMDRLENVKRGKKYDYSFVKKLGKYTLGPITAELEAGIFMYYHGKMALTFGNPDATTEIKVPVAGKINVPFGKLSSMHFNIESPVAVWTNATATVSADIFSGVVSAHGTVGIHIDILAMDFPLSVGYDIVLPAVEEGSDFMLPAIKLEAGMKAKLDLLHNSHVKVSAGVDLLGFNLFETKDMTLFKDFMPDKHYEYDVFKLPKDLETIELGSIINYFE